MKFEVKDSDQMIELGKKIAGVLAAGDLVLLNGELGAGKTTLTRGIGEGLGAIGTIQSPTFVLARTHKTTAGPKLVHVDAYRLSSAMELDDLDIDFANSVVVVEWARDYVDGLAQSYLEVNIDRSSDDEVRQVTVLGFGARFQEVEIAARD
ncbi:MAG: tRNA (adenosine(37)-N6)-threonylcarbamoyltransferase complex ATPase subunit type 1 TsaE [Aquiluna sp.]|nr:tRNA (adenosine(37)-N6)-threonylcarbamoyltransferase complex ATPase subunit type 1 TsaE [Aquiluna sp.]MCF8545888.1 tRNA (adenosine(37)-N6)-threonylcarbamoyltransferase complex ATPase subunit type 1 TsaE [Aquiluna sp.]